MRVLLLGPCHAGGSLPPYLDGLTAALRRQGVIVDRRGSTQIPYDPGQQRFWPLEKTLTAAHDLDASLDLGRYDLVALHSGNLEYDQFLPALWAVNDRPRPPVVWHVHTLDPTLLRDHIPSAYWDQRVRHAFSSADGYVYFGRYARQQLEDVVPSDVPGSVAWLPTTIPSGTTPAAHPALKAALTVPSGLPVISLYGYAAPWKNAALLHTAAELMRVPARIVLAGDFWDDPQQTGVDITAFASAPIPVGAGELVVVPGYLGPADRASLVAASTTGVFPYRPHPSFQGSGAIADYLAHGVPAIATNVANMAELVDNAGHIVPAEDPQALASALDHLASNSADATKHARARSRRFTAESHAAECLALYQQVLDGNERRPA